MVKAVNNVSFELRAGEIVAVAGINGNGQQEMVEAILGSLFESGQFGRQGNYVFAPQERRQMGLCYVPKIDSGRFLFHG